MLIFTENTTARLQYVLNFIFRDVFSIEFTICGNPDQFKAHEGPKINYSGLPLAGALNIPVSGLLSAVGIEKTDPAPDLLGSLPILFRTDDSPRISTRAKSSANHLNPDNSSGPNDPGSDDLNFDLFAAVFYMISRYEEYLPFETDLHGRFEAGSSLASQNGFLETPVVDLWIQLLEEKLRACFPGLKLPATGFQFQPSCDIDLPYAFLHRGSVRTLGARVKAGLQGLADSQLRQDVLNGKAKDPFDTFDEMEAIHSLHKIRPKIFFLCARYGKFDKSISPGKSVFKSLVKQCMKFADVGIHPSYRSHDNPGELQKELKIFSGITGEKVLQSRQHFLKFRLPQSYRNYMEAGIREDYSMGFASAAGFRAGTSRPFFFYDLPREEETPMKVIPFQVMDRTLKDYMKLTPEQAIEKISMLADATRKAGGTFVSIWHNDAFSDHGEWKGWKDVYLQMIDSLSF
ncbi:polysaccharide deacetylase family protein [Bacteroidota bacterium]